MDGWLYEVTVPVFWPKIRNCSRQNGGAQAKHRFAEGQPNDGGHGLLLCIAAGRNGKRWPLARAMQISRFSQRPGGERRVGCGRRDARQNARNRISR